MISLEQQKNVRNPNKVDFSKKMTVKKLLKNYQK